MAGSTGGNFQCEGISKRKVRSKLRIMLDQATRELMYLHVSAFSQEKVLIVPDKDADGLAAGVIMHRTLTALGLPSSLIETHLVEKGSNVHKDAEKLSMEAKEPRYVIIVDQGSRAGPPIVDSPDTKCLIIDHHLSDEFPENSVVRDPLRGSRTSGLIHSRLSLPAITHLLRLPPCLRTRSASHCIPP